MRRPNTPARLAPARSSTLVILSVIEKYGDGNAGRAIVAGFTSQNWRHASQHGIDPHPRSAHSQPEERQPRAAAQPAGGDHRAFGLGQELVRVRYALRRRPAALRRVALGLRAPVPRAHGEARSRSHRGALARDRHRAEGGEPQPALDGGHGHRDPRLPAPALRARRHALLPRAPARARSADGGRNGRPGRRAARGQPRHGPRPGDRRAQRRAGGPARRAARAGVHARAHRRRGARSRFHARGWRRTSSIRSTW